MLQTAVFVDAGYLFAAGSALITGSKKPRTSCSLDIDRVTEVLSYHANLVESNARLLRIYWYDGIRPYSGPSAEQMSLGQSHNIKLRLGMLNSQGQQKGVDSLIVTDLIDLARNKALSDALILAGDEDLRVGVQVAQSFGVRVHLLGIEPTRGNVSPHLVQEIDSLTELNSEAVAKFLTCAVTSDETPPNSGARPPISQPTNDDGMMLAEAVDGIFGRFDKGQLLTFKQYLTDLKSLPREVDAPLMGQCRHALNRDLTAEEKRQVRQLMRQKLESIE